MSNQFTHAAVYVQTNDASENELIAFGRNVDGALSRIGAYKTGGRGSGTPHLPSQGSVALAAEGRFVLVANAGSSDISVFGTGADDLVLVDEVAAGGAAPRSIAVHGSLVYVLNTAEPAGVAGFTLSMDGKLTSIAGSAKTLSAPDADPAQVAFSPDGRFLVVTERGTNSLSVLPVGDNGLLGELRTIASSGATPYGFDFSPDGALIVTEAFGGVIGAAAASSYRIADDSVSVLSASIGNTRSEVCWAVVTPNGRFVYVTNFGDGTISSYGIDETGTIELVDAVAATTSAGEKGVRDEAITPDGEYLYALDADARRIFGWKVGGDGRLEAVTDTDGLPATVAGLAAS